MDDSWAKVYSSEGSFNAELVKQLLGENDIDAVIMNKKGYPYNIGEVEVYVKRESFTRSLELIVQHDL